MKENRSVRRSLLFSALFSVLFLVLVGVLCTVDVRPAGAFAQNVGFSHLNAAVYALCGCSAFFYEGTELVGFLCFGVIGAMALLGLWQWFRRKQLLSVDAEVLTLVPLYLCVAVLYLLFEGIALNYRPDFPYGAVEDALEASFPSSHTLMALCVFGSARSVLRRQCDRALWRRIWSALMDVLCVLMVVGRLLAGVHWFTDILGSVLLSLSLLFLYRAGCAWLEQFLAARQHKKEQNV